MDSGLAQLFSVSQGKAGRLLTLYTASIEKAAAYLKLGRAIIFPTDTVYGLGVAVNATTSPAQLYALKKRAPEKAIPWLVADVSAVYRYGRDLLDYVPVLARRFWPGSLTLVVNASDEVPKAFRSNDATIALRMPDNKVALSLIKEIQAPLATSSANVSHHTPPQNACDIDARLLKTVPCVLLDSAPRSGLSSTVLDCTGERPRMLRVGAITEENLIKALQSI